MEMKFTITKENAGERIDKFIMSLVRKKGGSDFSRGDIIRSIKKGAVLVNGALVRPSYSLKEGDELEIKLFPESAELIARAVHFEVIYDDENLIAINKPAGLQVHPSQSEKERTVVNGLISEFPEIVGVGDESKDSHLRPGIVHRLDKDTSGVMVIARNQKSFDELKSLFKSRKMEKKYWAIIYGVPKEKEGVIEADIARATSYKKQVIAEGKTKTKIRSAVTKYKVIKEYGNYSLVEVIPKTGRMHQIRVHMLHIGNPLIGDKIYRLKNAEEVELDSSRQLLHAKELKFELLGKEYHFEAPIPDDFKSII